VSLVREAAGTGKFLPEDWVGSQRDDTPSSTSSARTAGRKKRAISNPAAIDSYPKKVRGKGKENGRAVNGHGSTVDT
jgi:hypothetical protein